MPLDSLVAFGLVFLIDSLSPGPAVATLVAKSATRGAWRSVPFIAGLVVGDLVLFACAVAGLAALVATMGPLFAIVKWAGIAYLLWLAVKMWRSPLAAPSDAAPEGEGLRLFALGALLPLGNPKAIGFYIALLPAVMDVTVLSPTGVAILAGLIIAIWTAVLGGYALAADRAQRLVRSPRGQVWLNRTSAGAVVGAAGVLALR